MTPANLSLWNIEEGLYELVEAGEEAETEEARIAVQVALAEYVAREVDKVDGIRGYIKHCEVMEAAARGEAQNQSRRSAAWKRRAEWVRTVTRDTMQAFRKKKFEGRTGSLLVRQNGGVVPLKISDEALVPAEYKVQVVSWVVDTVKLRQALEDGVAVPGAYLEERGTHLEVR